MECPPSLPSRRCRYRCPPSGRGRRPRLGRGREAQPWLIRPATVPPPYTHLPPNQPTNAGGPRDRQGRDERSVRAGAAGAHAAGAGGAPHPHRAAKRPGDGGGQAQPQRHWAATGEMRRSALAVGRLCLRLCGTRCYEGSASSMEAASPPTLNLTPTCPTSFPSRLGASLLLTLLPSSAPPGSLSWMHLRCAAPCWQPPS
mgnify:CR=1 FL=1